MLAPRNKVRASVYYEEKNKSSGLLPSQFRFRACDYFLRLSNSRSTRPENFYLPAKL